MADKGRPAVLVLSCALPHWPPPAPLAPGGVPPALLSTAAGLVTVAGGRVTTVTAGVGVTSLLRDPALAQAQGMWTVTLAGDRQFVAVAFPAATWVLQATTEARGQ